VGMQQNTPEWLAWRKKGIGASESAAILGLCPYNTAHGVWLNKTGRTKEVETNFAMQRGSDLEGKARAKYELISMQDMNPVIATHPKYEILRASLDGISEDKKTILELKVPSLETHEKAKKGIVPDHYMIQIQHQLLVTGAEVCHFFTYSHKDESHALVEVIPNLETQGEIVAKCLEFWKIVESNTPPPLTERDVKYIDDNPALMEICQKILVGSSVLSKDVLNSLKAEAIKLGEHPKIMCGRVRISTVNKNGKFSYHKLTITEAV